MDVFVSGIKVKSGNESAVFIYQIIIIYHNKNGRNGLIGLILSQYKNVVTRRFSHRVLISVV